MVKIIIRTIDIPLDKRLDTILSWFFESFGLTDAADKDGVEFQILKNLTYAAYKNTGLSSSELKEDITKVRVVRSTVIYHLNKFIDSGLVIKKGRKYFLRSGDMERAIEEIEYDLDKEMMKMLDAAKEFDKLMYSKASRSRRSGLKRLK